jgi:hypothetical protein
MLIVIVVLIGEQGARNAAEQAAAGAEGAVASGDRVVGKRQSPHGKLKPLFQSYYYRLIQWAFNFLAVLGVQNIGGGWGKSPLGST